MMLLADSHIHLFRDGFTGTLGISPVGNDELTMYEVLRGEYDIDCALVVAAERGNFGAGNNDYVAELARKHDWIEPLAYLPVSPAPTIEQLERLAEQGFTGVTMFALTAEESEQLVCWPAPVLRRVGELFRVVSLNVAAPVTATIRPAVEALHNSTVLFSHLGLPGRYPEVPTVTEAAERIGALVAMAELEHVGVKISGYTAVSEPPFAYPHPAAFPFGDVLLEAFGAGRLHWGSNYPAGMRWVSFPQVVDLRLPHGLSESERGAVLGGNLRRVLGR